MLMAGATLPKDIIAAEILPKLPVKSVLRFKCVCKFFKTLISSPEFVQSHLRHSLSSETNRLLILPDKVRGVYAFPLDSPEFPTIRLRFPAFREGFEFDIPVLVVGSCNGLVCIRRLVFSLIIFNPSTGIYKEIECANKFLSYYGFGFDDINDDYKIVEVATRYSDRHDDYGEPGFRREVKVYSLKLNSWSLIETKSHPERTDYRHEKGALIDNHLVHWKFWDPLMGGYRIVCFDLRNDQWGDDVALPDYHLENSSSGALHFADLLFETYRHKLNDLIDLGVLDGCLCLLTQKTQMIEVDVWVMKEYGVKESWVKLAGISSTEDVDRPLAICPFAYRKGSRSEILVQVDSQSEFFWYNIRDKTRRRARIPGLPPDCDACICKGSLVGIAGFIPFQIGASQNRG